jgi:hypothetical protein
MNTILHRTKSAEELHAEKVAAYWLMFLRCPGKATAPGEVVDLGEIGESKSNWGVNRWCPYSTATGLKGPE